MAEIKCRVCPFRELPRIRKQKRRRWQQGKERAAVTNYGEVMGYIGALSDCELVGSDLPEKRIALTQLDRTLPNELVVLTYQTRPTCLWLPPEYGLWLVPVFINP